LQVHLNDEYARPYPQIQIYDLNQDHREHLKVQDNKPDVYFQKAFFQEVVLLVFFAVGAAVGVLAMLANVLQQRREIARLKRDIRVKNNLAGIGETQQMPIQPS